MAQTLGLLGSCPIPSLHKKLNISETVQIPTHKPYIFVFLQIRHIQSHKSRVMTHPLHFIKGLISQKTFRSPTLNHIRVPYVFIDKDLVSPGYAAPLYFIKGLIYFSYIHHAIFNPCYRKRRIPG